MTVDEHRQAFTAFVAGLLGDFYGHLARGVIDLARHGPRSFAATPGLDDAAVSELRRDIARTFSILPSPNAPGPGRKRRSWEAPSGSRGGLMRKLIYSMERFAHGFVVGLMVTLTGWLWTRARPGFNNQQMRQLAGAPAGRGLYETMVYLETADRERAATETTVELLHLAGPAGASCSRPRSRGVEGKARLLRDGLGEEVARLKAQDGNDLGVGGAGLAGACARLGLIDEYRLFIAPGGARRRHAVLPGARGARSTWSWSRRRRSLRAWSTCATGSRARSGGRGN